MRLFMALSPPPDVLDEIEDFTEPHRKSWPSLRWAPRDRMHVTLAFFGDVEERTLDRLVPRLERAAARHEALDLCFAGGGAFPGGGAHARVLWTGLYGDRRTLARLAASCSAAGRRAGVPLGDHKSFRAHLTLARCGRPTDVRPLLEELSSYAGRSWTAGAVHLMRSHLGPRPHYETIKSWSLGR